MAPLLVKRRRRLCAVAAGAAVAALVVDRFPRVLLTLTASPPGRRFQRSIAPGNLPCTVVRAGLAEVALPAEGGLDMGVKDPLLQLASGLLPEEERRGAQALYAWCRRADEICDNPEPPLSPLERVALLEGLEADFRALRAGALPANTVDCELLWALRLWPTLGDRPFLDMLSGMRAELRQSRFANFEPELRHYAYCVAGTVGLMLLPLLGVAEPSKEVEASAIELGVAIQLVNILRDVGYDAGLGRIYLPQEDLQRFGVEETDVLARRMSPAYRRLIRFEVSRTRELLCHSAAAAPLLPWRSQVVVLAVRRFMDALLEELVEGRDCDNLSGKVRLGTLSKVRCILGAVWDWAWLGR